MEVEIESKLPSVTFRDAMVTEMASTENGAVSLATSQPLDMSESINGRMTFFFKVTRSLLTDKSKLFSYLRSSHAESVRDTLILVFQLRNCRNKKKGGKGERALFRMCVDWYVANGLGDLIQKNLHNVVEFGRWDDVLKCPGGPAFMAQQLLSEFRMLIGGSASSSEPSSKQDEKESKPSFNLTLASKWAPSAGSKTKKSKFKYIPVMEAMNQCLLPGEVIFGRTKITEREYRKVVSFLRSHVNVLERTMCANQWDDIEFNKVSSNAMNLYGKKYIKKQPPKRKRHSYDDAEDASTQPVSGAFYRHCQERFQAWKEGLKTGRTKEGTVAKVNASQLYPHEIVAKYHDAETEDALTEAQWNELEDRVKSKGSLKGCLFMADVSGSMGSPISNDSSVQCMDVSVALSLLGSRCTSGSFQNLVMTFSDKPCFFDISTGDYHNAQGVTTPLDTDYHTYKPTSIKASPHSLFAAVNRLLTMSWGANTNLQRAFDMILQRGLRFNVPDSEMPRVVVIVSDMQFDEANNREETNVEALRAKYKTAGYTLPTLVFWNVRTSTTADEFPVSATEQGTILISGYSPSIMSELMEGDLKNIHPWKLVRNILDSEVYQSILS